MKVENEFIEFWIEKEILFSQFKLKTDIDLEKSKPIIQLRHQISGDKSQYWCNDIKNIRSYSIEARNYAQIHGQDLLFASAVIVHSKINKLIFNVFLKLRTPKIPFKSFSNKEEAVVWLYQIKAENEQR